MSVTDVHEVDGVYVPNQEFHVFAFMRQFSRKARRWTIKKFTALLCLIPESIVYTLIIAASIFGWTAAVMFFYGSLIIAMSYGFVTFAGVLFIWCLFLSWNIQRLQHKVVLHPAT